MRSEAGFTLIETLVAAAITVVVFGSVLTVLDVFQRDNRRDTLRAEAQDNARNIIDALGRELRNGAAPSSSTPGALEVAQPNEIVFQTIESHSLPTGENVTDAIRVRYCLDDRKPTKEVLWRQIQRKELSNRPRTTACEPPVAGEGYEAPTRVAKNIVNRDGGQEHLPLFKYVPSTAVGHPEQVTGVEPNLCIDVAPGQHFTKKEPERCLNENNQPVVGETQLTTAIDLRNENRPPVAFFTAKEVGSRIVELDGGQSTDPDGLALSYKWFDNGTPLGGHSSLIDTGEETLGKHVFKLTVTTPSGLEKSAEESLTVT